MELNDLLIKGYTFTYDGHVKKHVGQLPPMNEWQKDDSGVEFPVGVDLSQAQQYLCDTYLKPFADVKFGYKNIWNKTDTPTTVWHNDLIEGSNIFFLYYLNDVKDGGEICFKVNNEQTGCIQPRQNLLVLASQEESVRHKVNHTNETRIVCNFGFKVSWT